MIRISSASVNRTEGLTYNQSSYYENDEEMEESGNEELLIAPYKWHEACFCESFLDNFSPNRPLPIELYNLLDSTYFCKIACDADRYCKGYFNVQDFGCAIVSTKLCPVGCSKYFEGNRGELAKNVPFSKLVGQGRFKQRIVSGCYAKGG